MGLWERREATQRDRIREDEAAAHILLATSRSGQPTRTGMSSEELGVPSKRTSRREPSSLSTASTTSPMLRARPVQTLKVRSTGASRPRMAR